MKTYHIYTDGACSGNPGPGGCAAIIVDENNKEVDRISYGFERTTNNRMEIMAVANGLFWLSASYCADNGIKTEEVNVIIHSDSQLVVNTMNLGWSKKTNTDLWMALEEYKVHFKNVTFVKVKGHANDYFNNEADKAAVEARDSKRENIDIMFEISEMSKAMKKGQTLFPEQKLSVKEIRLSGVNTEKGRSVTVSFSNNKETVLTAYNDGVVFSDVTKEEAMLLPNIVMHFGNWLNGGEL